MNKLCLVMLLLAFLTCVQDGSAQDKGKEPELKPAAQLSIEKALLDRTQLNSPDIDIDLIMLGEDYCGVEPGRPSFSIDGNTAMYRWRKGDKRSSRYLLDLKTHAISKMKEEDPSPVSYRESYISSNWKWAAYRKKTDLIVLNLVDGQERVLISDDTPRSIVGFALDDDALIYRQDKKFYVIEIATRLSRQLLTLAPENDPKKDKKEKKTTQRQYIEEAELGLLRWVYEAKEDDKRREERAEKRKPNVQVLSYPKGYRTGRMSMSRDLASVVVHLSKRKAGKSTEVPQYVTKDGYVDSNQSRSKVGDGESSSCVFLGSAKSGTGKVIELDGWTKDYSCWSSAFSPDSSRLAFVARTRDNKRAGIFLVDTKDMKVKEVHQVKDEAWVRHVGDQYGFLPDNRFWFTSEKTGFNHLYAEGKPGGEIKALTSGSWLIEGIETRDNLGQFYLTTSRKSAHTRQLEALPYDGSESKILVSTPGWNAARISLSGAQILNVHSKSNHPPELFIRATNMAPDEAGKQLTDSPSLAFKSHQWYQPKIHYFTASDGIKVPMRLYVPEKGAKNAPTVIFVHGAGYLQNVVDGWSPYFREYMFHNYLREKGYVVADVDYRGSKGYGRDWRTAIYRHMGDRDLQDQVDAVNFLIKDHGIAKEKVGIYGGSYGGFIALMAMFTEADVFRSGAALRPVTDWAHYNHGYTSNILNVPHEDPEAFERSSPIHFAEGLKGDLLICHGLVDSNVQVQDTFRLSQRLIELRKTNWEVALYPVEPHGFRDQASWADEYKRILKLFETTLK
ncbi:MAG: dipeptidyl aminopeptidase/acylaminoacyl peptidase [Planctomycetota bacterium]|jgi:dipeptidyl aminopeptidase/acylaminoacyl peptidase